MDYLRDPDEIYRQSFAAIRAAARLDRFDADEAAMAIRLVHTSGMPDIADDLMLSPGAVSAGRKALAVRAPIVCDVAMVAAGVTGRLLPADNRVFCAIGEPEVARRAKLGGTTRSAAAIEFLADRLDGAVVAIGNAPTALFRLLEGIEKGWPRPALVLGFPVGFVGATESKQALIANELDLAYVALPGRRGGSAMAAAAVNALAAGLGT